MKRAYNQHVRWHTQRSDTHRGGTANSRSCGKKSGRFSHRASKVWQPYKDILSKYKQALLKAKKNSWIEYCESLDNIKDTARIAKNLAKEHTNSSLLNRLDGSGTMSAKESLEILAHTHFPGNTTSNNKPPAVNTICNCWNLLKLICKKKLRWAISTFETYKSPGPDEIIPKMLQTIE